jgi:hypothetical protein
VAIPAKTRLNGESSPLLQQLAVPGSPAPLEVYCSLDAAVSSRALLADWPVQRREARVKALGSEKPTMKAISVRLVCSSRR